MDVPLFFHSIFSAGNLQWINSRVYSGAILAVFGSPLLLGSAWTSVPAAMMAVLFIVRTHLEDLILQKELVGYKEYVNVTRYRLLLYVW